MPPTTIDRVDIIARFHQLMQDNSKLRVLRLIGSSKQGKTHLMTKVFPDIAEQHYHARYVPLDLRSKSWNITHVLQMAHDLLGGDDAFPRYCSAYDKWISRTISNVTGVRQILSVMNIDSRREAAITEGNYRNLISQFVTDVRNQNNALIVFLFDTINEADGATRELLMDVLCALLAQVPHVRVVIAGQDVPEASGSYVMVCDNRELTPVEEEEAYIAYCREIGIGPEQVTEQDICTAARFVGYAPGLFVDNVWNLLPREVAHV